MSIKHNFKHVDQSNGLKDFTEILLAKISHLAVKESQWVATYSFANKLPQVTIRVINPYQQFTATAQADTFYEASSSAADKLGKQLWKQKKKLQNHKKFERTKSAQIQKLNHQLEYISWNRATKKAA
jgi:ribosome-associated translation inhibitor RaiA